MRITCYHRTDDPALSAFAEGARSRGHRVTIISAKYWRPGELDSTAECVVVVGLHGSARALRDLYAGRGVPVIIMDLPRLREIGADAGFTRDTLHWLPPVGGPVPATPGLVRGRTPVRVLVVGQKPLDAAHGHLDSEELAAWARGAIADLRALTDLPIHFRPHPLGGMLDAAAKVGADAIDTAPTIRAALRDAAAVVTYNSTVGWDAIDAGVPLIATAPRELVGYAEYCTMGMPAAWPPRALPAAQRRHALGRVARTCFTLEALFAGDALDVLLADVPAVVA